MSPTHPVGPSSPNFQLIFNNALKAYEKQTKNDLLSHPLAAQLQACQSPGSILTILQQQVQDLDQSRTSDERLTKWLNPTVNVLYAFSETIGEGASLVRQHGMNSFPHPDSHTHSVGFLAWKSDFCRSWCSPFRAFPICSLCIGYL